MYIILFVKSVSPSYSITANYQQVLASMKSHSPLLCGATAATKKIHKVSKSQTSRQKTGFKSLLTGLEEEFGQLTLYGMSTLSHIIHFVLDM